MKLILKLFIYGIVIPFIVIWLSFYITNYFQKYIPEMLVRRFNGRISENFFYNTLWYYLFCVLYKIFKNRKRKIVVLIFLVLIPFLPLLPFIPLIISWETSFELIILECSLLINLLFYLLFFASKWMYNLVNNKINKVEVS